MRMVISSIEMDSAHRNGQCKSSFKCKHFKETPFSCNIFSSKITRKTTEPHADSIPNEKSEIQGNISRLIETEFSDVEGNMRMKEDDLHAIEQFERTLKFKNNQYSVKLY